MRSQIRPAVICLLLLTLVTGVVYPLVVTGIAHALFPAQAHGSVLVRDGQVVGSDLIGQPFTDPRYFWPRPSATSPFAYNGEAGAGSNLAPSNPELRKAVKVRTAAIKAADPQHTRPIPVDLVTASASGLDPHISPAAADYQVARVARARRLDEATVRRLVAASTEDRQFGLLGEPRVNVLGLNLALDAASPSATERSAAAAGER